MPRLPTWGCAGALVLLAAVQLMLAGHASISNDSYQYLSVAANLLHGHVGQTSILHWDEDRLSGSMPAPMTNFPMGYPLLVGALSALGVPAPFAGLLVSLAASLGTLFLLDRLARQLGVSSPVRTLLLVAYAFSAFTAQYAVAVLSEATFTFAILAGLVMLLSAFDDTAIPDPGKALGRAVAAGLLFGAAYWVRYAGLFIILAVIVFGISSRWLAQRPRGFSSKLLIAGGTGLFVAALGMLRNHLLVGSWRGGNNKYSYHSYGLIAHDYAVALRDLILGPGDASGGAAFALRALLLVALLVAVAGTIQVVRQRRAAIGRDRPGLSVPVLLVGAIIAVYMAGLVYAAARTVIDRDVRYLLPLYPEMLALLGVALQRLLPPPALPGPRRRFLALWGVALAVFASCHGVQAAAQRGPARHDLIAAAFQLPIGPYPSLPALIAAEAGAEGVVMGNNGQALGYLSGHPTVSLIGEENSRVTWTEEVVRDTARRYGVALLVIQRPSAKAMAADLPSPFVAGLAAGSAPPWLRRVASSDAFAVYAPAR